MCETSLPEAHAASVSLFCFVQLTQLGIGRLGRVRDVLACVRRNRGGAGLLVDQHVDEVLGQVVERLVARCDLFPLLVGDLEVTRFELGVDRDRVEQRRHPERGQGGVGRALGRRLDPVLRDGLHDLLALREILDLLVEVVPPDVDGLSPCRCRCT